MVPRKLDVLVALFAYGGNGGTTSLSTDVSDWKAVTYAKALRDERVGRFAWTYISDTPITMTRNQAVIHAQRQGFDVLIMVDSDMYPDIRLGRDPLAKPFWDSSFDYLYSHYEKGPVSVYSPYCGPDPHPNHGGESMVYIFQWTNISNGDINEPGLKLEMFPRTEAVRMAGVQPVDAAGTGLCMFDMRLFDHLTMPYFDYEWKDDGPKCGHCGTYKPGPRAFKSSTEDCMHTRDMSLVGYRELGYNPVLCNWDAWSGHWKPRCVDKPYLPTVETVNDRFTQAVLRGHKANERMMVITPDGVSNGKPAAVAAR